MFDDFYFSQLIKFKSSFLMILKRIDSFKQNVEELFMKSKKIQIQKKIYQEFISKLKLEICVSSPQSRKEFLVSENEGKKILIVPQKGCFHDSNSFMKDLSNKIAQRKKFEKNQKASHCDRISE